MEDYPKFWQKAIKGSVGGRTLNKKGNVEEFLLKGDPHDLENDVTVEIHDEDAEKYFLRSNKSAIKNGYLVQISDVEIHLDSTNAVSDGFLKDILKMPYTKMVKEVGKFTSPVPVARLLDIAMEQNKPVKTIEFITKSLVKLEKSKTVSQVGGDNVTVKSF